MPFMRGRLDVHQHDIRLLGGNLLQGFLRRWDAPHEAQRISPLQQFGQAFTGAAIVFDDGNSDAHVVFSLRQCGLLFSFKQLNERSSRRKPGFWFGLR